MHRSLLSLIGLISFWSIYYAGVKYFFWGIYEVSFAPSLEQISGSILIGSMLAYLIGGKLYSLFGEKRVLIIGIIIGALAFIGCSIVPRYFPPSFFILSACMGFAYSLYVIGKNNIIGREMVESKLSTTLIGAYTTVSFIVAMILGTIIGSKLGESVGYGYIGYIVFLIILSGATISIFGSRVGSSILNTSTGFSFYKKIFLRYGIFMLGLACFWEISVEVSQVAIRYSKDFFGTSNTASSLLLIFSSVGAILGNMVSVKLAHKKNRAFLLLSIMFLILIVGFGWFLHLASALNSYFIIQLLAFLIGFFFGGAVNLAESHFFHLLGSDPDKDYISSFYGFTIAFMGTVIMFTAEYILSKGSYMGTSLFLGSILLFAILGCKSGLKM